MKGTERFLSWVVRRWVGWGERLREEWKYARGKKGDSLDRDRSCFASDSISWACTRNARDVSQRQVHHHLDPLQYLLANSLMHSRLLLADKLTVVARSARN